MASDEHHAGDRRYRHAQRQRRRLDAGHLSDVDVRIEKRRGLASDDDVGVGDPVQATTGADAIDRDDHRYFDTPPGKKGELVVEPVTQPRARPGEARHVGAGLKAAARAGDDHAAHTGVGAHASPELRELDAVGPRERVQLLRTIERHDEHRPVLFDEEALARVPRVAQVIAPLTLSSTNSSHV